MIKNQVFKLIETYESSIDVDGWLKFLRIELFESTKTLLLLRARVWLSESYNLYPSAFNTNSAGNNTKEMHSAEILSRDITVILPFGEVLLEGKVYQSKQKLVDELFILVEDFLNTKI